ECCCITIEERVNADVLDIVSVERNQNRQSELAYTYNCQMKVNAVTHKLTTANDGYCFNPTIYTSCIQQFWDSTKVKTVNEDVHIRALVDGKKIINTKASIRRDLRLDDAEGTACLPNAAIFEELARMSAKTSALNEFSSTMASAIICLANNQKFNFSKYIFESMMKSLEAGVEFYMLPRFVQVFVNHQLGDMSHHKGIFVNPSLTKNVFANMKRVVTGFSRAITPLFETMMEAQIQKETEVPHTKEHIPTHSHDPLPSGEDRMQLSKLMEICTKLSDMVLSLEQIKTNQAAKIEKLKKIVKKLKGKKKKITHGLKRLYKVGLTVRVESYEEEEGLGDQEDPSKQGRIAEIDVNEDLSLITSENVERDAIVAEKEVSAAVDEVVTTAESVEAKPMARGVIVQEPSKFRTTSSSQPSELPQAKEKGKGIMVEPEKPLKRKDQIALDEEVARNLEAEMKAKIDEEEMIAKEKNESNRSVIKEWDDVQAIIDVD
nr:hypothetical protein [Tanacetum cinerariifolium]